MKRNALRHSAFLPPMGVGALLASAGLVAALSVGCEASTRHRVLTFLFDGVPPLEAPEAAVAAEPEATTGAVLTRRFERSEHGPAAAKMCDACHNRTATNALVVPQEDLCFRCHEFKMDKRFIHGPLASGGCLVCHDPHSSQYRYLLVSQSDNFCFDCHDPEALEKAGTHEGMEERCTICHDAHMSDEQYLLK